MHLLWHVFKGNSRVTNWVRNSSYAWLSFGKKIHAISFVFKFVALTIIAKTLRKIDFPFGKSNLRENSFAHLALSWRRPLSYRNQSIDWFLYDNGLRHERVKAFPNFSFVCFHCKITWHLGKVTKKNKTERVSNWIDAQSSCLGFPSFSVPTCWLPKTTNKLLL